MTDQTQQYGSRKKLVAKMHVLFILTALFWGAPGVNLSRALTDHLPF